MPSVLLIDDDVESRKATARLFTGKGWDVIEADDGSLGIDLAPKVKIKSLTAPEKRQAGRKLGSVQELVQALHTEAKVI